MKILIIDDSKVVHTFIKSNLGSEHTYLDAFDGSQALELLKNENCDVILLDWEMPILSGIETLTRIRENDKETPIIMVTSLNRTENVSEALEKGANDYVMKPFTKEIIEEKIESVT